MLVYVACSLYNSAPLLQPCLQREIDGKISLNWPHPERSLLPNLYSAIVSNKNARPFQRTVNSNFIFGWENQRENFAYVTALARPELESSEAPLYICRHAHMKHTYTYNIVTIAKGNPIPTEIPFGDSLSGQPWWLWIVLSLLKKNSFIKI